MGCECECVKCKTKSSVFWHTIEVNGQSGWLCDKCMVALYDWIHNDRQEEKFEGEAKGMCAECRHWSHPEGDIWNGECAKHNTVNVQWDGGCRDWEEEE